MTLVKNWSSTPSSAMLALRPAEERRRGPSCHRGGELLDPPQRAHSTTGSGATPLSPAREQVALACDATAALLVAVSRPPLHGSVCHRLACACNAERKSSHSLAAQRVGCSSCWPPEAARAPTDGQPGRCRQRPALLFWAALANRLHNGADCMTRSMRLLAVARRSLMMWRHTGCVARR